MPALPPHTGPSRIIVRGVNWLGDAVMTTPALARLRERFPEAQITLLSPGKLVDLWTGHPAINEVTTFAQGESPWSVARRLRKGRFQAALIFPNSPRSALEMWFARIPQRIGYARPWRNAFLTQALPARPEGDQMQKRSTTEIRRLIETPTTAVAAYSPAGHHIHEYLQLTAALGADPAPLAPRLEVAPAELQAVAHRFGLSFGTPGAQPFFGLNAGAEYGPAKRWPAARFIAAACEIQKVTNCVWLLVGSRGDATDCAAIESALRTARCPVQNLAGQTSLRELCAVLKLCRLLLTNDTGPMHVAAAVGTPVVAPFGSTSPELTGPGLPGDPRHQLLKSGAPCSPCFLRVCPIDFRCMMGISVERVVESVLRAATK
jgi:lipopolysaccharide heptosyltransferase II